MDKIQNISISNLVDFTEHPFLLYNDERLENLAQDIQQNGILMPLVVRPIVDNDGKFEILSGHNRKNAAEKAEMAEVPCIVKEGLSNDEAKLIVVGSNLNQRSFSDMKHSEKARVIKVYYDALSALSGRGFRTDLLNLMDAAHSGTLVQVEPKLHTRDKIAAQFGLSAGTVQRYIRLNGLIPELLALMDEDKIGVVPAVNVSFLSKPEQQLLFELLNNGEYSLKLRNSKELKVRKENSKKLLKRDITDILSGVKNKPHNFRKVNIYTSTYETYFDENEDTEKINETIQKALELYFEQQP